jgi:hypothetical protein
MPKKRDDCVMQCSNCAYYRAEQGEEYGKCHRYPPVWITSSESFSFDFPAVDDTDYCGEFAREQ